MAVKLSALLTGCPLPPGRCLVLISVRGWVDPRAIVQLEGLSQVKNPVTSLGIEPATFQLDFYCYYNSLYDTIVVTTYVQWMGSECPFIGPSVGRTKELLKLNRNQLRWVTGLLAGHCHLNGHLFKMRLTNSPTCKSCLEIDESATHILCDCETIAYLRFLHLGHYFMEPGDYQHAPVSKILHFIQSVVLLDDWIRGDTQ
jgi:hypothetical protein